MYVEWGVLTELMSEVSVVCLCQFNYFKLALLKVMMTD